jgi:hypothetical protein
MQGFCPGHEHVSRRALLKGLAFGGVGAAAVALMNWGNLVDAPAFAAEAKKKSKQCVLLWMNGGASQFETFDMKIGRPTGGPFRDIKTNLPGYHVCELLPKMAQQIDKLTVIRSMRTSEVDHPGGIHLMHTGYSMAAGVRFPEIGAVVAKYNGSEEADLPQFIKISSNGDSGAGFLGPMYSPFSVGHEGNLPSFAARSADEKTDARRQRLRDFLEDGYAADHHAETSRAHREGNAAALRLQRGLSAFKIDDEWEKNKPLYGDSLFGKQCMLARKLIERGVPFVEVGQSGYDTHADNFTGHKGLLPSMDVAWAGLLTDLKQRGLLDTTLVIWMGEIGRTPTINNRDGRDHYVKAWTAALAGGGVKGGLVYGETDADGVEVKDNPVTEGDYFATIYTALGINPAEENYAGVRPIPLAPFRSKVVKEILA